MTQVNVGQAKAKLSSLIERVLRGEEVVISRRNQALVRMTPVQAPKTCRRLGWAADKIWVAEDFDETPEDFSEYIPHQGRGKGKR